MKKNQVKRILAMTIAAALILGSFSGCGKSDRSTTAVDYETEAPADDADSGAYAEVVTEEPYWDVNDGSASAAEEELKTYAELEESDTGSWDGTVNGRKEDFPRYWQNLFPLLRPM